MEVDWRNKEKNWKKKNGKEYEWEGSGKLVRFQGRVKSHGIPRFGIL